MNENELYNLSDEELEKAFLEAKAGIGEVEEVDDGVEEESEVEEESLDEAQEEEVEEIDDEELDDEAEQPGDDTDSDETDQDDELDEAEESTDEPDGDDVDEPEVEDEESDEPESVKVDPLEEFLTTPSKAKANGTDYEFTNKEKLEQFDQVFAQAANYTQKMQAISEWKKPISALKDNGFTQDDVNTMIDIMKGDKDAITQMIKKAGIDVMDLDTEKESAYVPREYGRSDEELAIDDVIGTIEKDQEFAITQNVVDKQWDSRSRQALAKDPRMIQGLHNDVKSGLYDKVSPMAMKLKVLDGGSKSDIEYYIEAGTTYTQHIKAQEQQEKANNDALLASKAKEAKVEQEKITAVKQKKAANSVVKKAANKRKAAAPTKKASGKKDVVDYLDEFDEGFNEWENNYRKKYG